MDQLSSCYFCGDALDASLDEHPVVPASVRSDTGDQQTVVLCGDCKRKFDAVMDTVVEAVDERGAVETTDRGTDTREPADRQGARSAESDIEATLGDDEEVLRPVDEERSSDADSDGSSTGTDGPNGEDERTYTGGRRAGYTGEDRASDPDTKGAGDPSPEDATGRSRGTDTGTNRSDQPRQGAAGGSSDEDRADDVEERADEGGDENEDKNEADVTLTRLENTKVMRLLRNRDFPVGREDFVTVAASAYEVSPKDCDRVVELAIEHDLLREENGQLYGGPQWE